MSRIESKQSLSTVDNLKTKNSGYKLLTRSKMIKAYNSLDPTSDSEVENESIPSSRAS